MGFAVNAIQASLKDTGGKLGRFKRN